MAKSANGSKIRLDYGAAVKDAVFHKPEEKPKQSETISHHTTEPTSFREESYNDSKEREDQENKIEPIESSTTTATVSSPKEEDIFKTIAKSGRGVQSTVYFEREVYDYIKEKSEQYNAKFSNVVNLLLKEIINKD